MAGKQLHRYGMKQLRHCRHMYKLGERLAMF